MEKISKLEENIELFLNNDSCYGSFYIDSELNEMARFGKIPNSKYEIHIQNGEGNIPHFHLCIKSGKNIVLRIKLLANEYFREKDDLKHILNSKERKALNNYLESTFSDEFGITKWQSLCLQWNENNPTHKIENIKFLKKPNYSVINEPN